MNRPSRRTTLFIIALSILAAGVAGWRSRAGAAGIAVTTAVVERVPLLQSQVTASGEIVASRYAEIGANVMGRLVALSVKEGDAVKAGQVVARIDSVQAAATATGAEASLSALEADARAATTQVRAAQATLDEARARAAESSSALERAQQLRAAGLMAAADFDRLVATDGSARAQIASAAASVTRAQEAAGAAERRVAQGRAERARVRDQLSKTEITAPIDGVVTRLDVEVGEMVVIGVQNQPGTILMTISDLSAINAEVKVAEADVMRLANGLPATVTLEALSGQRFAGHIVEIGASALPQLGAQAAAREFRVKVRLDRTATPLRPGLTCDAEIIAVERRNVLAVPLQSVVERGGRSGVFTVADGRARFVPVTSGIIGGLSIEVDGVTEGSTIVAGPIQALRDLADGAALKVDRSTR
jgi:HlyD family secretion protein